MLVFEERGKPEYPEKNLSEQGENQQQTQPTYDAETENRTRATLVGGECSHHYTTTATLQTVVHEKLNKLESQYVAKETLYLGAIAIEIEETF